jgi:hypothetical protein
MVKSKKDREDGGLFIGIRSGKFCEFAGHESWNDILAKAKALRFA